MFLTRGLLVARPLKREHSAFRTVRLGDQEDRPMKKTVARHYFENFGPLVETEIDPAKRQTLVRLLPEQEAKLARLTTPEEQKAASGFDPCPETVGATLLSG